MMDVDKSIDALDNEKIATTHEKANLCLVNDRLNFVLQSKMLAH